jgi:hypothetical protein
VGAYDGVFEMSGWCTTDSLTWCGVGFGAPPLVDFETCSESSLKCSSAKLAGPFFSGREMLETNNTGETFEIRFSVPDNSPRSAFAFVATENRPQVYQLACHGKFEAEEKNYVRRINDNGESKLLTARKGLEDYLSVVGVETESLLPFLQSSTKMGYNASDKIESYEWCWSPFFNSSKEGVEFPELEFQECSYALYANLTVATECGPWSLMAQSHYAFSADTPIVEGVVGLQLNFKSPRGISGIFAVVSGLQDHVGTMCRKITPV